MSVKVTYNCYINLCEDYMYGKNFLDLPEEIQDAVDEYFDGAEILKGISLTVKKDVD